MENEKYKFEGIYTILNKRYAILYLLCKTFLYDAIVASYRDEIIKGDGLAYRYWFAENVINCTINVVEGKGAYIGYVDVYGELRQMFISDTAFKWITFGKFPKPKYYDDDFFKAKLKHLYKNSVVVNDTFIEKDSIPFILSMDMEAYLKESKDKAIVRQMEREIEEAEKMKDAILRAEKEDTEEREKAEFEYKSRIIISNVRRYEIL